MRSFMRARRYSLRTEQAYLDWVRRFILFHAKRHPREMAETEIVEFLTHLATQRNVAASTQNQALSALLFLYQQFLEKKLAVWTGLCAQAGHRACQSCLHAKRYAQCSPTSVRRIVSWRSCFMAAACDF